MKTYIYAAVRRKIILESSRKTDLIGYVENEIWIPILE